MNKNPSIDCLGLGIMPFDILYTVEKYPAAETKIDAKSFFMQGGGPVPSVMVGLSRLGFKTGMIGVVGNDPIGDLVIKELKDNGVDSSFVVRKNKPSAVATGWIESGTGRRTLVLARDIFVNRSDLILSNLPIPKLIHLDGRDIEASMKLAKWAKRVGAIVSFDIGSMRNDVSSLFPFVDHLVVADSYAFPFTGSRNARKAIRKLSEHCLGTIVVTEGVKGSTGVESGCEFFQPAFRVKTVDTTGAGDAFHTGYLFGLLNRFDLAECLKLGSAVAAIKCKKPGARTGLPSRQELSRFLNSKPKTYSKSKK